LPKPPAPDINADHLDGIHGVDIRQQLHKMAEPDYEGTLTPEEKPP
jgi:hypothetical protein